AQLLGSASASDRPRLMSDIARAFPALGIEQLAPGAAEAIKDTEGQHLHGMRRHLGHGYKVMALSPVGGEHRVGVELPDGTMIAARVEPEPRQPRFWGSPWMMTLLFALISVTTLGLWAAHALARPLSSFAQAAEGFSLDGTAEPLPERGPEEIRSVA